jgi:hypothetical protein
MRKREKTVEKPCTFFNRTLRLGYIPMLYTCFKKKVHGFYAGFTVFSHLHCKTHGFFSVYFRFRKPASPDQTILRMLRRTVNNGY